MLKCEVCGYEHEFMISNAHLKTHGMTSLEYKEKFPGARLRIQTEAMKAKIAEKNKGPNLKLRGIKRSEEQKKASSERMKKKFEAGEITHWNTGNTTSEETRKKISEGNKNIKNLGNEKQRKAKEIRMREVASEYGCTVISFDDDATRVELTCNVCNLSFSYSQQILHRTHIEITNKLCPCCQPRETFASKGERELAEYIESLGFAVIRNDREVLGGKEIDVYIPVLKIGFEYTGLFWHAQNQNPEPNHLIWKKKFAAKQSVKLYTVFEDEWELNKEIVKSRISSILNVLPKKIFARKCRLSEIDSGVKNKFLVDNHIQGKDSASISYGLFFNSELVAVATFKRTSMVKGGDGLQWELSRFCNKINSNVVGGASKLIKHFVKTNLQSGMELISYADLRWSFGDLYKTLGFTFDSETSPSYWYLNDYKTRVHRSKYMKHRLIEKYGFSNEMSEREMASELKLDRIYDCGSSKWIFKKP